MCFVLFRFKTMMFLSTLLIFKVNISISTHAHLYFMLICLWISQRVRCLDTSSIKGSRNIVFLLYVFLHLLSPAGGALPSGPVLCGWEGGAQPSLRFPWRSASLRVQTQLEWQARSSRWDSELRRTETERRSAGSPQRGASHRGEQCSERVSPRAAELKSCAPSTRTLYILIDPFPSSLPLHNSAIISHPAAF